MYVRDHGFALMCHSLGRTGAAELLVDEIPRFRDRPARIAKYLRAVLGADSRILGIPTLEADP